jgi:hypothetical protein
MGDFDFNGFVDDDDVTLLSALYDPSAPPLASAPFAVAVSTSAAACTAAPALASGGSSAIELAAVPEPSTLALASIVGTLLLLRRRAHHAVRYTERA